MSAEATRADGPLETAEVAERIEENVPMVETRTTFSKITVEYDQYCPAEVFEIARADGYVVDGVFGMSLDLVRED